MEARNSGTAKYGYGLGAALLEGIIFVDLFIDMYTGKLTWQESLLEIAFCVIIGLPIAVMIRNYFRSR